MYDVIKGVRCIIVDLITAIRGTGYILLLSIRLMIL